MRKQRRRRTGRRESQGHKLNTRYQDPAGFYYCITWEDLTRDVGHESYNVHEPGARYCRQCWPPRGRGRGEDQYSPRRLEAQMKAYNAYLLYLRAGNRPGLWRGLTYEQIARHCGYGSRGSACKAIRRYQDQLNGETRAAEYAEKEHQEELARRRQFRAHQREN